MIGLMCVAPRAYEYSKAFASAQYEHVAPVVVAPVPPNLFALDGDLLASITPARSLGARGTGAASSATGGKDHKPPLTVHPVTKLLA